MSQLNRSNPKGTYTKGYLQHVFSVVEAFKTYPNVLGFFAGNEIINDLPTSQDNPPIIRAVQRDLKIYIANNAPRQIPVGYSAADVREVLEDTWAYLQCQIGSGDDMSRSDFFGLNSYSWCGSKSNFQMSGYDDLAAMFARTTIPVFFSEYGCNDPLPRVFDEVPALYGPQMTVLSGGLIYEWTQEPSDYGLIQTNDDGSAKLLEDFDALQSKYNTLDIGRLSSSNDTATTLSNHPPAIPTLSAAATSAPTSRSQTHQPGVEDMINTGISNPPKGSLVKITQTAVQVQVMATNGNQLKNLAIQTGASSANSPGAVGGTGGGSSSSSGAASAPTGNAGVVVNAVAAAALGVVAFAL